LPATLRRAGLKRLRFFRDSGRPGGVCGGSLFVALDESVTPALSAVGQFKVGARVSAGGDPPFEGPARRRVTPGELAFRVEFSAFVGRHLARFVVDGARQESVFGGIRGRVKPKLSGPAFGLF